MIGAAGVALAIPTWMLDGLIMMVVGLILAAIARIFTKSLKSWIHEQFQLLLHQVTPNGGNTDSNGDITKRIELKLDEHVLLDLGIQKSAKKETKALRREVQAALLQLTALGEGQKLAAQTAENVRDRAETTAIEVAKLAVSTASDVAQKASTVASDLAERHAR